MREINILFLGGAKRVSLAEHFILSGEEMGVGIKIFSYELDVKVPLASVATILKGMKWNDAGVVSDLVEVIKNCHINIVLPFVDPAVQVVSKLKPLLSDVFIPSCDIDMCEIMFDKKLSEQWFVNNGISIPKSYSPEGKKEYPIIIKPRNGSASKGIRIIENEEDWNSISTPSDYVIQKYISNHDEYTVDCYVDQKGDIISIVPRIRLTVAGGEVVNSLTVRDDNLIHESRRILQCRGFYGPVTIQFIRDKELDMTYVMEINPRLGGGVITSIEAGADISAFILREFMGQKLVPCYDWKDKTLMTRYFKEVIFYADNN